MTVMNWNDCKKNFIRKVKVDPERARVFERDGIEEIKKGKIRN